MRRDITSIAGLGISAMAFAVLVSAPVRAQIEAAPDPAPATQQTAAPADKDAVKGGKFTLEQAELMVGEEAAEKMALISQKRQLQIDKLKALLSNPDYRKDPARAPKVIHMLAEAYWEESFYQYMKARQVWDSAYEQFDAGTLKEMPPEPQEDYVTSLEYYRTILKEFPEYSRFDEVLFYIGKGAMKEGKAKKNVTLQKEGVNYLDRLVKNYPESKWLPQAHLAMAEYYFETNKLYYAQVNYEVILNKYPKAQMFNYAQYKLSWVYFNLSEMEKAIEGFKKVVAAVSGKKGKGVIDFRNQALSDLVVCFAEIDNGWQQALDYFKSVLDTDEAYVKMRTLADLYVGQEKIIEAIDLFRHFIEREKTTKGVVEYYTIILSLYQNTNDLQNLDLVTMEALNYFDPKGTWYTANKKDEEITKEADTLGEKYVFYLANYYHREAQKLEEKKEKAAKGFYAKAADKYRVYLSRFSEWERAYVVNFYYAEILYVQLEDYEAATEQYNAVIARDTKGEYVEDAALGVIYCYGKLMAKAGLQEMTKSGKLETFKVDPKNAKREFDKSPLHPLEVGYVKSADKYVSLLMELLKDPEVRKKTPDRGSAIPEIMFLAADVLYKHGEFEEAVVRLKILFDYEKTSKYAAYAVFTLLDCYQRLNRWPQVEEWARNLIKAKNFTVKKEPELRKIVAIAMTENARVLSMENKFDAAGKEAMRVYEEFKSDKVMASAALYNVAVLYEDQRNVDRAIDAYKRVAKEYPDSEVAPKAIFSIGSIQESQTEFENAAKSFENMAQFKSKKKPTDSDKDKLANWEEIQRLMAEAFQNAGLIREALGDYNGAIKAYETFTTIFPDHADTPKVSFRIGLAYEAMGDAASYNKAFAHYQKWLLKKYKVMDLTVEAWTRSGDMLKKTGKVAKRLEATKMFNQAIKQFNAIGDDQTAIGNAKKYAAQAAFELADYGYDDFAKLTIPSTLNPTKLKKALTDKAESQIATEAMFNQVLDFKSGPWSAGALFKIGLLYYEFKEQLLNVPVPEGLDPDTEVLYLAVIDEIAAPVEAKALRAFENALNLAHDKKVYNDFSKSCAQYAAKVNQDTFPVSGDDQVYSNRMKDSVTSISFINSLKRGDVEIKYIEEAAK
jgi:tetratricopeptide (TPR) repeat protein